MRKKVEKKTQENPENEALKVAINTVYQKYGTDLTAFYRDVRNDLIKKQETPDSRTPAK